MPEPVKTTNEQEQAKATAEASAEQAKKEDKSERQKVIDKRRNVKEAIHNAIKLEQGEPLEDAGDEKEKIKPDKEGAFMFKGFMDAITSEDGGSKGRMGNMNSLYQETQTVVDDFDDNPEANAKKTFDAMTRLYKMAQLGEYKIDVKKGEGKDAQAIVNKLKEDFTGFAEKATEEYWLADYIKLKADAEMSQDALLAVVDKGDSSRAKMSKLTYDQRKKEENLTLYISREARNLYPDKRTKTEKATEDPPPQWAELNSLYVERKQYQPEDFVPLNDRKGEHDQPAKADLIAVKAKDFKDELTDQGRPRDAETFNNMQDVQRENLVGALTDTDLRIDHLNGELKNAIESSNSETARSLANQVKNEQLRRETQITKIEAGLAAQRKIDAEKKWTDSTRKLGEAFGLSPKKVGEATGNLVKSYKELIGSKLSNRWKQLKSAFAPIAEKAKKVKQTVGQVYQDTMNAANYVYEVTIKASLSSTNSLIERTREGYVAHMARTNAEFQNQKTEVRNSYYDEKDKLDKARHKRRVGILTKWRNWKRQTRMFLGEKILSRLPQEDAAGEKTKAAESLEKVKKRRQNVRERYKNAREKIQQKIDEEDNPHLGKFVDAVKKHVRERGEEKTEEMETETALPTTEDTEEVKASEVRPNAEYYELVHRKGKNEKAGQDDYLLYWWNGSKLMREITNQQGENIEEGPVSEYEAATEDEAKALIDQEFAQSDENYDFDRNTELELPEEEKAEEEAGPPPEAETPTVEAADVRTGAKYYELVHGVDQNKKRGGDVHLLYHWDGNDVSVETVDQHGKNVFPKMGISKTQATTLEDAQKFIDRQVKGTLRGYDVERNSELEHPEGEKAGVETEGQDEEAELQEKVNEILEGTNKDIIEGTRGVANKVIDRLDALVQDPTSDGVQGQLEEQVNSMKAHALALNKVQAERLTESNQQAALKLYLEDIDTIETYYKAIIANPGSAADLLVTAIAIRDNSNIKVSNVLSLL